nr:MAG TPA: hypothetical protein [Caudoviricetes sp.]
MIVNKKRVKELRRIRDLQKQALETDADDYMVGLYNGLEFAVAIMEDREPVFETTVSKETQVIEHEEEKGRTVKSGIIKRR